MATRWLSVFGGAFMLLAACSGPNDASSVQALERTSKSLRLKAGAGGASEGDFIKFSAINYTIYENGRIDLHGDVSFIVPLLDAEIDVPFTRTYNTNAANVKSERYKTAATAGNMLQTDRLAVDVRSISEDQKSAKAVAQINRNFHWADLFWGFDKIYLTLDLSGPVVGIDRIEIRKGFVYYDALKKRHLPKLNDWDDNDDWDGGGPWGPVFMSLAPSDVIEEESNDETKIHRESVLILE